MCCGVPDDVYDVVIVVEREDAVGPAFVEAFLARERRERVAVVLPCDPRVRRLRASLDLTEITLIEGRPRREDAHYLDVDGRLVYGERVAGDTTPVAPAPAAPAPA